MGAFAKGSVIAAVVAGPTLYSMVKAGNLDATQAIERGAVVAIGVAVGVTVIEQILDAYKYDAIRRHALEQLPPDDDEDGEPGGGV